jgi:sec-independent protein translocase protein TatB
VAIIVIGPKDLPLALRTAGRWIGKIRRVSGHFRAGVDAMIREAELEDMEKKWKAQNEEIMARTGDGEHSAEMIGPPPGTSAEASIEGEDVVEDSQTDGQPQLPLDKTGKGG